jgi:hypothetical protein
MLTQALPAACAQNVHSLRKARKNWAISCRWFHGNGKQILTETVFEGRRVRANAKSVQLMCSKHGFTSAATGLSPKPAAMLTAD